MILPVFLGVLAAALAGIGVGLWAAVAGAPPEAAAAVASVLGGILGFSVFGAGVAVRLVRRVAPSALRRLQAA